MKKLMFIVVASALSCGAFAQLASPYEKLGPHALSAFDVAIYRAHHTVSTEARAVSVCSTSTEALLSNAGAGDGARLIRQLAGGGLTEEGLSNERAAAWRAGRGEARCVRVQPQTARAAEKSGCL